MLNFNPPYYSVIFSSIKSQEAEGYDEMAIKMVELAKKQVGYLGYESLQEGQKGITISYWKTLEDIKNWKENAQHIEAQIKGKTKWYKRYSVKICKVEGAYEKEF